MQDECNCHLQKRDAGRSCTRSAAGPIMVLGARAASLTLLVITICTGTTPAVTV